MNLLLSSNGLTTPAIRKTFLELSQGLQKQVAIITTGDETYKEKNRNVLKLDAELKSLDFKPTFIDVEFDDANKLKDVELIIISGGNPYFLLYHLKRSGADQILIQKATGKGLIYGISAGVFVLMQDLSLVDLFTPEMNTIHLQDKEGLGLVKVDYLPHFDRFTELGIIKENIIQLYEQETSNKVYPINENEFVHFK